MKTKVIVDTKVILDPPSHVYRWGRTPEGIARELKIWASDLEGFIRDHRSQDPVSITVEHEYQEQCSHCHREWEEDEDGPVCCNDAQEEWKQSKVAA